MLLSRMPGCAMIEPKVRPLDSRARRESLIGVSPEHLIPERLTPERLTPERLTPDPDSSLTPELDSRARLESLT